MQITVENCSAININTLQKTIKRIIRNDLPSATKQQIHDLTLEKLNEFTANEQIFEYEAMENYLGGYRWFFKCPKCKKRSTKLFLPPKELVSRSQKYYCKGCHKLKNQSALQGQNNIFRKVTRPLRRMKDIEEKIAGGHLTKERVQELLNEYERIEEKLRDSPEYRLYVFKIKHNL